MVDRAELIVLQAAAITGLLANEGYCASLMQAVSESVHEENIELRRAAWREGIGTEAREIALAALRAKQVTEL
jgi:hypothetical protein